MPKHKPIKFEGIVEPNTKETIKEIVRKNPRAKSIATATLALIAVGGILTTNAVAPGILLGLTRIMQHHEEKKKEDYRKMWQAFNRLKKQGAVKFVRENNEYLVYRVSNKGKERIRKFALDELAIKKPKHWDKKWRLVIFDIPEKYSNARKALQRKLKDLGFYQCQKSAWIHPFPCLEEVEFVKDIFNIKPFVKIFLVEEMTDGKTLYHFSKLLKNTTSN